MELTLKDRKKINNLPKLNGGYTSFVETPWLDYSNLSGQGYYNMPPVTAQSTNTYPNVDLSPKKLNPAEGQYPLDPKVQNGAVTNGYVPQKAGGKSDSQAAGAGPWFAIGSWLGGGVLEGFNNYKSSNELLSDAGTSQGTIGGIAYQRQSDIDKAQYMKDYRDSAFTDFWSNPGRAITKFLFKHKQEKAIERANIAANNLNNLNRSGAYTEALQQDYNLKHTDTRNTFLRAENGKDAVEAAGGETNMKLNAWVNKGEYIWDGGMNLNYIDHGPNDTAKAFVKDTDTVFTTKNGIADMVPYAAMTGQLPVLAEYQRMLHNNPKYKNGKCAMPRLAYGWDNLATSGIGALASLGLIIDASRQDLKIPNIYSKNKYGNRALTTLAGIRSNPYPVLQQMRSAYDNAKYDINRAGGQSGAQKYLANVALGVQNQRNVANAFAQLLNQNLGYMQNYANVSAQIGAQEAANQQAANQYREQYAAAAHAAKQQDKQMGIRNLMDYINQFYKNRFKLNQFNRMYNLYAQDVSNTSKNISNLLNYNYS